MRISLRHSSAVAYVMTLPLVCAFSACSNDAYDTGDGSLSYMRADFVEASTNGSAHVVSAVTDNGTRLSLSPHIQAEWIEAKDSTYRALLYYNNVENGNGSPATVKPLAISNILVPSIIDGRTATHTYPTDPVTLETAWMSKSQRYINLGIIAKTGTVEGKAEAESFGIVLHSVTATADGHRCFKLRLVHNQNNVPEYYSTQVYMSIPLYRFPTTVTAGDSFEISINTYKGTEKRTFNTL